MNADTIISLVALTGLAIVTLSIVKRIIQKWDVISWAYFVLIVVIALYWRTIVSFAMQF